MHDTHRRFGFVGTSYRALGFDVMTTGVVGGGREGPRERIAGVAEDLSWWETLRKSDWRFFEV